MMVGKAIDDVIRTIVGYYGADADRQAKKIREETR